MNMGGFLRTTDAHGRGLHQPAHHHRHSAIYGPRTRYAAPGHWPAGGLRPHHLDQFLNDTTSLGERLTVFGVPPMRPIVSTRSLIDAKAPPAHTAVIVSLRLFWCELLPPGNRSGIVDKHPLPGRVVGIHRLMNSGGWPSQGRVYTPKPLFYTWPRSPSRNGENAEWHYRASSWSQFSLRHFSHGAFPGAGPMPRQSSVIVA